MKKCFVPVCLNNSDIASRKYYFVIPTNKDRRRAWFRSINRKMTKSVRYCCEDHFNLKEDCTNFPFAISKRKPTLKKSVEPHLFLQFPNPNIDCSQLDHKFDSAVTAKELSEEVSSSPEMNAEPCSSKTMTSSISSTTTSVSSEANSLFTESSESSEDLKKVSLKRELAIVARNPRFYLGLPQGVYILVKLISSKCSIIERDILITLKKIRLNDAFFRLAIDFDLSRSQIGKIYNKSISTMASVLKHLIFWPDTLILKRFLPIPFRLNYSNVASIIDCFEISIEKPSNSLHQALTWSSYKNCNTVKYLVSSTPYGFINFISNGFGGRASDITIVENTDYLKKIPENVSVLADRGFKHISSVLAQKNVSLVRPPSVSEGTKLSKEEVRAARSIAALRVHIERVISRLREFHILSPHAQIDNHLLGTLDAAVIVACAIVNLQPSLITMS